MIVTLDFYNNNFYIKTSAHEHYWNNAQEFLQQTGYPFTTTKLLSLEPHRDIYHVQRDSVQENSVDAEEIVWFLNSEASLDTILTNLTPEVSNVITLETERLLKLYDTDWIVQRHQEEVLRGVPTTLTAQQFTNLLNYKQQLRDLTNTYSKDTPTEQVVWPTNPLN